MKFFPSNYPEYVLRVLDVTLGHWCVVLAGTHCCVGPIHPGTMQVQNPVDRLLHAGNYNNTCTEIPSEWLKRFKTFMVESSLGSQKP